MQNSWPARNAAMSAFFGSTSKVTSPLIDFHLENDNHLGAE